MAVANEAEEEVRRTLDILQSMIDVSAERLEGLRTQCATSAELTRQEIRTLEGKLIKLFSQQLVTKLMLKNGVDTRAPSVKQWLQVVGLSKESIGGLCQKISSVEELQEKSEHELKTILSEKPGCAEELSRLCRALHNLKKYTDVLKKGESIDSTQDSNLSWDSWDRHQFLKLKPGLSPRSTRSRASRASVPSEENLLNNNNKSLPGIATSPSVSSINLLSSSSVVMRPPLTPPAHNSVSSILSPQKERGKEKKFPTTPPARRKHVANAPALLPDNYPLTKSKSHESQLATSQSGSVVDVSEISGTKSIVKRARLPTEPGPETMGLTSPVLTSPIKSPPYNSTGTDSDDISSSSSYTTSISLPVPGKNMVHRINHRFTRSFKMMTPCGLCLRPILGIGLKCKECKYTCHRECENQVAPSCGLPTEYLDEFKKTLEGSQVFPSPLTERRSSKPNLNFMNSLTRKYRKNSHSQPPPPDSSSNTSSCNSSTPSSPAVHTTTTPSNHTKSSQFHFPDPYCGLMKSHILKELTNWEKDQLSKHWRQTPGLRQAKRFITTSHKRAEELIHMNRKIIRMVVGLLTEHCPVKYHLKAIGKVEDDLCRFCDTATETA